MLRLLKPKDAWWVSPTTQTLIEAASEFLGWIAVYDAIFPIFHDGLEVIYREVPSSLIVDVHEAYEVLKWYTDPGYQLEGDPLLMAVRSAVINDLLGILGFQLTMMCVESNRYALEVHPCAI